MDDRFEFLKVHEKVKDKVPEAARFIEKYYFVFMVLESLEALVKEHIEKVKHV